MDISLRIVGYPVDADLAPSQPLIMPKPHSSEGDSHTWHFENTEPEDNLKVLMPYKVDFEHLDYVPKEMFFPHILKNVTGKFAGTLVESSAVESIQASSTYNDEHSASMMLDGDPFGTAWVSGKSAGAGAGETITITFKEPTAIASLGLLAGKQASKSKYRNTSRPKIVELVFDGGGKQTAKLSNGFVPYVLDTNMQLIEIEHLDKIRTLTIKIVEVFKGKKYKRVGVSEILLFGP
jgi:hypothetical protein